jgi:hypothetical protein
MEELPARKSRKWTHRGRAQDFRPCAAVVSEMEENVAQVDLEFRLDPFCIGADDVDQAFLARLCEAFSDFGLARSRAGASVGHLYIERASTQSLQPRPGKFQLKWYVTIYCS